MSLETSRLRGKKHFGPNHGFLLFKNGTQKPELLTNHIFSPGEV